MKPGDAALRTVILYDILKEKTDMAHVLAMPQLIAALEEHGISADRRTVYRSIAALNQAGHPVRYRRQGAQGYYAEHLLSCAETKVLCDAIQENTSLSLSAGDSLQTRLLSQLSQPQAKTVQILPPAPGKTDSDQVLNAIGLLMQAAAACHPVRFLYFDYTAARQKQYRRQHQQYEQIPYAVVCRSGRSYAILYSPVHHSFASFRIDRMEHLQELADTADPVPFDLPRYLQTAFNMYSGTPETVTGIFDLSLAGVVFDQFGQDILISAVSQTSFTASIRTSVTPTLISWLLQFYDRIRIVRPQSLIASLQKISRTLAAAYPANDL